MVDVTKDGVAVGGMQDFCSISRVAVIGISHYGIDKRILMRTSRERKHDSPKLRISTGCSPIHIAPRRNPVRFSIRGCPFSGHAVTAAACRRDLY